MSQSRLKESAPCERVALALGATSPWPSCLGWGGTGLGAAGARKRKQKGDASAQRGEESPRGGSRHLVGRLTHSQPPPRRRAATHTPLEEGLLSAPDPASRDSPRAPTAPSRHSRGARAVERASGPPRPTDTEASRDRLRAGPARSGVPAAAAAAAASPLRRRARLRRVRGAEGSEGRAARGEALPAAARDVTREAPWGQSGGRSDQRLLRGLRGPRPPEGGVGAAPAGLGAHPCSRFQKQAVGTRCELFIFCRKGGLSSPSRDGGYGSLLLSLWPPWRRGCRGLWVRA
ncbi:uncharacterized protein PS065_014474 [Dugong dugon]